jgi:hypothetical protein
MWKRRARLAVVAVLALHCAAARSDDAHKAPPADPDPGFLEFLGSVDRLADVNPDYLSQPDPSGATKPGARGATPALPPPPPPPPRQPLPPSASAAPGGQKNE